MILIVSILVLIIGIITLMIGSVLDKKIIGVIGFILAFFGMCFTFGTLINNYECSHKTQPVYEFIDMDNKTGIAKECSYKFKTYRSGGQGSPVCITFDNTTIMVKQYKILKYIKSDYCIE